MALARSNELREKTEKLSAAVEKLLDETIVEEFVSIDDGTGEEVSLFVSDIAQALNRLAQEFARSAAEVEKSEARMRDLSEVFDKNKIVV